MFDVSIVGCGVVGALIARELSKYKLKTCVLEASSDVCMGASNANSGIVHAGYDAAESTLKAKFNVLGNRMMEALTSDLGVRFKNNGSLVLGFENDDKLILNRLIERGIKNGAELSVLIDRDALIQKEPNIADYPNFALYAKSGGIVCPYELTFSAIGNAMDNGVRLELDFEVVSIKRDKEGFSIYSSDGKKVESKLVINCAGIYADRVAGLIGDKSFKIGARKGEYILLDRECDGYVNHTIFSLPTKKGKGVLITPTVDGNILIGPTSKDIEDKNDNSIDSDSFSYIIESAKRLIKNIPFGSVITSFCGIRAYSDRHDFILEQSKIDSRFINVAGIESPGLTAAPAIAVFIAQMAIAQIRNVKSNDNFMQKRKPYHFFRDLTVEERNEIIKNDGSFGKIVCRCEQITLGEIMFALNQNPIPKTVDALKRRTRAGMGRCQGGFCQPTITDLLIEHFDLDLSQVLKSGHNSNIFMGKIK